MCWRLACVADLVRASSLAAVKTSPKNYCWCRALAGFKAAFPCTTHTPVSFRSPAQHTKQGEHAKAKQTYMQREHPNYTIFRIFFSQYAVVGEAAISLRRRPARRHLVSTARTQTRSTKVLVSSQRGCFLNFGGPKTSRPGRFDPATFPTKTPPPGKKTAPAARPGAKVSVAPPVAPPRGPWASPDHPTWWLVPPGAHHGQGEKKHSPVRPLGAPTKTKTLTRNPPIRVCISQTNALGCSQIVAASALSRNAHKATT
jgi:hypothetical protein